MTSRYPPIVDVRAVATEAGSHGGPIAISRGGRIGPNAIVRTAEALRLIEGQLSARRVFRAADLESYLDECPRNMVDEHEVARLQRALCGSLGTERARRVNATAGRLTAEYLLAHRIPKIAQAAFVHLPASLAGRLLSAAITRHAWTFVGSGTLAVRNGRPTIFEIGDCPLCRGQTSAGPICDFYAASFEALFARLVHRKARAMETGCRAAAGAVCRFEISW